MEEGKNKNEEELAAELRKMVRQRITSFAQPDRILVRYSFMQLTVII